MSIPADYLERVYAGVLGKIIGVYLGRPFEGWTYEKITARLGEVWYYVHEQLGQPLVVTDDDIAGTFTFLRALPDHGCTPDLTSAEIGQSWLNYIIENRTILWWGGMGNSTEHTAYLRLKHGIPAPRSGSAALNGRATAEQIGAQIFIDGWAMVAPGDPELATRLAGQAARVSHDGEAVYAAQLLAAMESLAFIEPDLSCLLDEGLKWIPADCAIARLVGDLRDWHAGEPDWRKTRLKVVERYGYHRYPGVCHVIPNHAVIHLALLYGGDDYQKSLMIANTSGWDTDCNSGNVGCLLGIKNGLAAIDRGPGWRAPVADRMYLSSADGGRAVTDAAREAVEITNLGLALVGQPPVQPKGGARFHFELPGSVQGFQAEEGPESAGILQVDNTPGHSRLGKRSLALWFSQLAPGRAARAATPTFIPPEAVQLPGYALLASPTLYPGQEVQAELEAGADNTAEVSVGLFVRYYGPGDEAHICRSVPARLAPGERTGLTWRLQLTGCPPGGAAAYAVGIEILSSQPASGAVYLDRLTWVGTPAVTFKRPERGGEMWRRAWVNGVDHWDAHFQEAYRLVQDEGVGLLMQGGREWQDYAVSAEITPHLLESAGLAARVQGMRRYYALLLCRDGKLRLVRELDGRTVLAEQEFAWEEDHSYQLVLSVQGRLIRAGLGTEMLFEVQDDALTGGAAALVIEEGCLSCNEVRVEPV